MALVDCGGGLVTSLGLGLGVSALGLAVEGFGIYRNRFCALGYSGLRFRV